MKVNLNDELEKLEIENSNNFTCFKFFSKDDSIKETNKLLKGRINSDFIKKLSKQCEGFEKNKHYICGPNELKETITSTLLQLNVPKSYILTEAFELVIDPKDFFDVKDSTVNINFQGLHSEIFVPKGKSILDIALDNNIDDLKKEGLLEREGTKGGLWIIHYINPKVGE